MEVIGKGSIVQRDKSKPRSRCREWELSILVRDNNEKKRKTKALHGITYSQAEEELEKFKNELRGTPVTSDMPLSAWIDIWKSRREESKAYASRTLRTDMEKLVPAISLLGDRKIGSIESNDIRNLYASVMNGNTPSGRSWSAGTVSRMRTSLSKVFNDAVAEGLIPLSPVTGVPIPKLKQESDGLAMPPEKMDEVLSSLDYTKHAHRAVALALACGLRRSECCALAWNDVTDIAVTVRNSCDDNGNLKPTKNGSVRTVPMPSSVSVKMLEARGDGRVCDMLPQSLTHWWTRHREELGCREYRFHDLRHSYATRLAASGVHMRVAMELCGWKSIAMAAKVYTHVSDDMQMEAVKRAFG